MNDIEAKRQHLLEILAELPGVAVALSGGVDSTVVAKAAQLALGNKAVAVTADSPSVPRSELQQAQQLATLIGITHHIVATDEFANDDYIRNDGSRCYFCKSELYSQIETLLPSLGITTICSGANLDDQGDYRPGLTAAAEHAVRHPLQEAGFTKADVRALAQLWELPVWDKPASPCLSSRLVPGLAVTRERTSRVEHAEAYLRGLGLNDCRVRHHEADLARIEVSMDDIAMLAEESVRTSLVQYLLSLGFKYVTLDLQGFRSGSMNDLIDLSIKKKYV